MTNSGHRYYVHTPDGQRVPRNRTPARKRSRWLLSSGQPTFSETAARRGSNPGPRLGSRTSFVRTFKLRRTGNIGTLHGPALHRELELMVRDGGLSTPQALTAATLCGAHVMGRADELGALAPGKLADFVVLDADPLADIRDTTRIHRVVKGVVDYAPAEIMQASARY